MGEPVVSRTGNADVVRRAVVTGAVVGVVAAGARIPLPFVDPSVFGLMWRTGMSQVSVLALGLGPFVSAFVLVELVALAVPALRRRRHGSFAERGPLTRAAWVVGLALAGIQAYGLVTYLRSVTGPYGWPLLTGDRSLPLLATGLTLVAGSAAVAVGASIIGRRGLGNGFAVLIAALPLAELPRRVVGVARELVGRGAKLTPGSIAIVALILCLFAFLFVRMLRARVGVVPAVPVPTTGIVPISFAASLLLLPAALAGWLPSMAGWLGALRAGGAVYEGVNALLVLALALLAARLFCAPRAVAAAWAAAGIGQEGPERDDAVRLALSTANALSVFLVLAVVIVPGVVMARLGIPMALRGALVQLLLLTAVALDVGAEARARARGEELVAVYPLHRVYAVEPALAALGQAGIFAHFRARYFRAMQHFFGPYVPIEVMVPAGRAAEAEEICARIARPETAAAASPAPAAVPSVE